MAISLDERESRVELRIHASSRPEGINLSPEGGFEASIAGGVFPDLGSLTKVEDVAALADTLGDALTTWVGPTLARVSPQADIVVRVVASDPVCDLPWDLARLISPMGDRWDYAMVQNRITVVTESATPVGPIRRGQSTFSVLVVCANPATAQFPDLPFCDREAEAVESALRASPIPTHCERLARATWTDVTSTLRKKEWDVVHVIGHAEQQATGASLALHDEHLGVRNVYVDEFATALAEAGVHLVVLSTCSTVGRDVSFGRALTAKGIPWVVGTRRPVRDASMLLFTRNFYGALARSERIDTALREGRLGLLGTGLDWTAPSLHIARGAPLSALFHREIRHRRFDNDERPFIGRRTELRELLRICDEPGSRLLTLTGTGGVGKSRLARRLLSERMERCSCHALVVDCTGLESEDDLLAAIARGLEVNASPDVALDVLAEQFSRQDYWLLIDGFERLTPARRPMMELLRKCPNLRVIVTSRRSLGEPWEREFRVTPMSCDSPDSEAFRLLASTVPDADRKWERPEEREAALNVCRRLEGVPLALILAGSRLNMMTVTELERLLAQAGLSLLRTKGGGPHSDFAASIRASFELVQPEERESLESLATFVGWFSVDDAASVLELPVPDVVDHVSHLRDSSLIEVQTEGTRTRFKILDPIREEVLREPRLSDYERNKLRRRHALRFLELGLEIRAKVRAGQWAEAVESVWFHLGNVRSAFEFGLESCDSTFVVQYADAWCRPLFQANLYEDFDRFADASLSATDQNSLQSWADLLGLVGARRSVQGKLRECCAAWGERTQICLALGDEAGACDAMLDLAWEILGEGKDREARRLVRQAAAIAKKSNLAGYLATARAISAHLELKAGKTALARRRAEEALRWIQSTDDPNYSLFVHGLVVRAFSALNLPREALRELTTLFTQARSTKSMLHIASSLRMIGPILDRLGLRELASQSFVTSFAYHARYHPRHLPTIRTDIAAFRSHHNLLGPDPRTETAPHDVEALLDEFQQRLQAVEKENSRGFPLAAG